MKQIIKTIKELEIYLLLWGSQGLSYLGSSMTGYALLIWVYQKNHSTLGVSLLAVCTNLPLILLSFIAGTFADRHNRKKIMLLCDSIAAAGTLTVFLLILFGRLEIWHIYLFNMLNSTMSAFQSPANTVTVSELVPSKYYHKIGGLQSISDSAVGILTPAIAMTLMTFFGINIILIVDIASFLIAFTTLSILIHPRTTAHKSKQLHAGGSFLQDCREGFLFLKEHSAIMKLIQYFTAINLIAYIGGGGITTTVTAMILSRLPDGKLVLGAVSSAVSLGTLFGGIFVTFMKPPKNRVAVIFISCAISFFICDLALGISQNPSVWIIANFIGNVPLAFLGANQSAILRTTVPVEMQGRVFSARSTLQFCTIPLGYLFGGLLSDYVFEPLMAGSTGLKHFLTNIVGEGPGSGISAMFIVTGITGTILSIRALYDRKLFDLDETDL
jgi:MFS family permease